MENQNLLKRIEALEKWKIEKTAQQISFPLDEQSKKILSKYFLTKLASLYYTAGAGGTTFKQTLVSQDDRFELFGAELVLIKYSVDTSTDTLKLSQDLINLKQGTLFDDTNVLIITSDTSPNPLVGSMYVVNASVDGRTIQLSDTLGGSAVNITDIGKGDQYLAII